MRNNCIAVFLLICGLFQQSLEAFSYTMNPEFSTWVGCISHHEAKEILNYRLNNRENEPITVESSIDLNRTKKPIMLTSEGLCIDSSDKLLATWKEIQEIADKGY